MSVRQSTTMIAEETLKLMRKEDLLPKEGSICWDNDCDTKSRNIEAVKSHKIAP